MSGLADALRAVVRGQVDDSPEALEKASRDASLYRVMPQVVVAPEDAEDIAALVRFVSERKGRGEDISLTPRAAGTDMSGGPLGDSIILDMTRHMNRFLELGDDYAVAEPGMYFRDFDKRTKERGLEMPGYPASRELATIGGMAANNAGGEKNLKYGKTARYVRELDVVMADGQVHTLRKLEGDALAQKLAERSFEGEVYRAIAKLVSEHRATIEKARPKVTKNSSGYALWDVGDPDGKGSPSNGAGGKAWMDLTKLIIGSQGALGVITKIRFGLVEPEPCSSMTVMFLDDLGDLKSVIPAVLAEKPDSFESYDDKTFSLAVKYFPEFALQMRTDIIHLGFAFLPEMWMLATGGIPKLVLLVEFRAREQAQALRKAEALRDKLAALVPQARLSVAKDERAARKFWAIRRESFNLLRKKVRGKRTAPFIDDFVVPPATLPEFLSKLNAILARYDLTYTIAGHVGDGNFHIIPLIDPKRPGTGAMIEKLSREVYELVLSYQGSISGEHNDGLVRTPYVREMFGPEMSALFDEVERIFDPLGIFNPGKKVGTSFADSAKKLDVPR
jgi:FAD/FMN-containing dehydrogenase